MNPLYSIRAYPSDLPRGGCWSGQVLRDGQVLVETYGHGSELEALRSADYYRESWSGKPHKRPGLIVRVNGSVDDQPAGMERGDTSIADQWDQERELQP